MINRKRKFNAFFYRAIVLIRYFRDFTFLRKHHVKKKITKYGSIENFGEISLNEIFKKFVVNPKSTIILKIDIEGFENELFSKNTEWIDNFPIIIIELHDWMLPKTCKSSNFLSSISKKNRDFLYSGENIFSIKNELN